MVRLLWLLLMMLLRLFFCRLLPPLMRERPRLCVKVWM
jgi:hypothetical protein